MHGSEVFLIELHNGIVDRVVLKDRIDGELVGDCVNGDSFEGCSNGDDGEIVVGGCISMESSVLWKMHNSGVSSFPCVAVLSQNNCMHRDGSLVDGSRGGGGIVCVEATRDCVCGLV